MLGHSEVSDCWIAVPLGMISCLAISTAGLVNVKKYNAYGTTDNKSFLNILLFFYT